MRSLRGFTLIELLIVVLILGVLATVALSQFAESAQDARKAMAMRNAGLLSDAIERYRIDHGVYPGVPFGNTVPTQLTFIKHLVYYTNAAGQTSLVKNATYPYGPYLRKIPINPLNGSQFVKMITLPAAVLGKAETAITQADILAIDNGAFTDEFGWLYCQETGSLLPNSREMVKE